MFKKKFNYFKSMTKLYVVITLQSTHSSQNAHLWMHFHFMVNVTLDVHWRKLLEILLIKIVF